MVLVYNVNFGPWLSANNLGQKREVLQEYMQMNSCPPEDRRSNLGTPLQHMLATYHYSGWHVVALRGHTIPPYGHQPQPTIRVGLGLAM